MLVELNQEIGLWPDMCLQKAFQVFLQQEVWREQLVLDVGELVVERGRTIRLDKCIHIVFSRLLNFFSYQCNCGEPANDSLKKKQCGLG